MPLPLAAHEQLKASWPPKASLSPRVTALYLSVSSRLLGSFRLCLLFPHFLFLSFQVVFFLTPQLCGGSSYAVFFIHVSQLEVH